MKLESLQVLRGLAALGVTVHHSVTLVQRFVGSTGQLGQHSALGLLGVDLFFVLSGFIILNSHYDDRGGGAGARLYAIKRLLRIFVPYLPVTLIYLLVLGAAPSLSDSQRGWSLFSSLTLLPSGQPPVLLQAWTLVHELLFYILFLTYFFVPRRLFAAMAVVWAVSIAATAWSTGPNNSGMAGAWIGRLLAPINFEFLLGMMCAVWLRSRLAAALGTWLLVLGLGAVVLLLVSQPHTQSSIEENRLLFGCSFAALIAGLAERERRLPRRLWRPLVWLGDSSYSQYLVHFAAASVIARVCRRVLPPQQTLPAVCLCVGAALVVTALYYHWFERRAIPAVREYMGNRTLTAP